MNIFWQLGGWDILGTWNESQFNFNNSLKELSRYSQSPFFSFGIGADAKQSDRRVLQVLCFIKLWIFKFKSALPRLIIDFKSGKVFTFLIYPNVESFSFWSESNEWQRTFYALPCNSPLFLRVAATLTVTDVHNRLLGLWEWTAINNRDILHRSVRRVLLLDQEIFTWIKLSLKTRWG